MSHNSHWFQVYVATTKNFLPQIFHAKPLAVSAILWASLVIVEGEGGDNLSIYQFLRADSPAAPFASWQWILELLRLGIFSKWNGLSKFLWWDLNTQNECHTHTNSLVNHESTHSHKIMRSYQYVTNRISKESFDRYRAQISKCIYKLVKWKCICVKNFGRWNLLKIYLTVSTPSLYFVHLDCMCSEMACARVVQEKQEHFICMFFWLNYHYIVIILYTSKRLFYEYHC